MAPSRLRPIVVAYGWNALCCGVVYDTHGALPPANSLGYAGRPSNSSAGFLSLIKSPDFELQQAALHFVELLCRLYPPGVELLLQMDIVDVLEAHQYSDNEVGAVPSTVQLLRFATGAVDGAPCCRLTPARVWLAGRDKDEHRPA